MCGHHQQYRFLKSLGITKIGTPVPSHRGSWGKLYAGATRWELHGVLWQNAMAVSPAASILVSNCFELIVRSYLIACWCSVSSTSIGCIHVHTLITFQFCTVTIYDHRWLRSSKLHGGWGTTTTLRQNATKLSPTTSGQLGSAWGKCISRGFVNPRTLRTNPQFVMLTRRARAGSMGTQSWSLVSHLVHKRIELVNGKGFHTSNH